MRIHTRRAYLMLYVGLLSVVACCDAIWARDRQSPPDRDITVVNLNLLHGFACVPATGGQCRVEDRLDLLVQHLIAAGCPDIVTLQENVTEEFVQVAQGVVVGPLVNTVALISDRLPTLAEACGFTYTMIFDPEGATGPPADLGRGIDEELILTRYPVLDAAVFPLYSPLAPLFSRRVLYTRIDHALEPIDVFTTHLASDSDAGSAPCGSMLPLPAPFESPPCPDECVAFMDTVRECQAKQMALRIDMTHDIPGPGIVTGDFNAPPFSNEYNEFADRGWVDSHLEAKNAECDAMTGVNCTAGREDTNLTDLESPELNQDKRIDYIFVIQSRKRASRCELRYDQSKDRDRDGTGTGLFANAPNPFAETCGPAPLPICWASDHSGNQLDLECKRRTRDD